MQLPSEMDSPLDRRAQTIDILTAEIERKNRTIKAWRIKYDELEEKTELLQDEVKELKAEIYKWQLELYGKSGEYPKWFVKKNQKKKANGKAKVK